jgi:ribosomal protein S18 acetylase RimI-like enzyme
MASGHGGICAILLCYTRMRLKWSSKRAFHARLCWRRVFCLANFGPRHRSGYMYDKAALLAAASNPRRATLDDAIPLSKMFAAAFMDDPLFDYMVRPGAGRRAALELFFHKMLSLRDIPQGNVWMSADGRACVSWLAPDARRSPTLLRKVSLLPFLVRVFSFARFGRGLTIMDVMEKNHPPGRHFYLSFIAVAPEYHGLGLGSRILKATLKQVDAAGLGAYVESSNPKNASFYERIGFVTRKNIAPAGWPSLVAMWRDPNPIEA